MIAVVGAQYIYIYKRDMIHSKNVLRVHIYVYIIAAINV